MNLTKLLSLKDEDKKYLKKKKISRYCHINETKIFM